MADRSRISKEGAAFGRLMSRVISSGRVPEHVTSNYGLRVSNLVKRPIEVVVGKVRNLGRDEDGPRWVKSGTGWVDAAPLGATRPVALSREVALHVIAVLEEKDLRPFVTGWSDVDAITVGLNASDRAAAMRAIDSIDHLELGEVDNERPTEASSEAGERQVRVWKPTYVSPECVFGRETGMRLEFWTETAGFLNRSGSSSAAVPIDSPRVSITIDGRVLPTYAALEDQIRAQIIPFPVDAVYTWVDGSDGDWAAKYRSHQDEAGELHHLAGNQSRFNERGLLQLSMRSLEWHSDFIRHIYVVTDRQIPDWLNTENPQVTVVDHRDIMHPDAIPTFNSHAIESRLHHIDGLSEQFLYFNDDVMFGRPVSASRFFTVDGKPRPAFSDEEIPSGSVVPEDTPVNAAAKNGRDLLKDAFGYEAKYKTAHVPFPQVKTLLFDLEERFGDAFAETERSRFRSHTDLAIPSFLSQHAALATGNGEPSDLRYRYVNVADRWARDEVSRLIAGASVDVVCLNETQVDGFEEERVERLVARFARSQLPSPSVYELGSSDQRR